ncbi:MAG: efflux RND transporter periplasmic adaptor subunit [Flavipsychrobacter sp.]|nr:efflux RND transporter periplasmic adaptor subunit [Flavipsychrobacter sp.]
MRIILLLLSVLLFTGCNNEQKPVATKTEKQVDTVKAIVLKSSPVEKQTTLPGELLPFERVEIHAKVAGYIRQLNVDIGSVVKQGQIIAVIDAPEIQSRVREAKGKGQAAHAKYIASKDTYDRILSASKTEGVISANELQKAKSQMEADLADYNAAVSSEASLKETGDYLVIKAPYSGVITERNVNNGAFVGGQNDKPIVVIEDQTKLRLRVAVPEALTGTQLKTDKIKFSVKSNPNQLYEAQLIRKAGSINTNTRTEVWEFEVNNKDKALKAGAFADVKLNVTRPQNSFTVPSSVVVTTLERKFVIKVSNGTTQWIDVSQGLNLADKIEIFGKLNENDTLVLKANEELKPDIQIVPKFE